MRVAITGHRPNKLGGDYALTSPLTLAIKQKIIDTLDDYYSSSADSEYQQLELISGMALGIDTLFARIAIETKTPFIAAIPFFGQYTKWQNKSLAIYNHLLKQAINIKVVDRNLDLSYDEYMELAMDLTRGGLIGQQYSPAKMQARNEWMVDNSDLLIAVWDGSSGGTSNCVSYATIKGKQIIRIDPNLIKAELGV